MEEIQEILDAHKDIRDFTPYALEQYIEENNRNVDWGLISCHDSMTQELAAKYRHELDWKEYTACSVEDAETFTEDFIDAYADFVNWSAISLSVRKDERQWSLDFLLFHVEGKNLSDSF